MKIYVNSNHEIKAINESNDKSLTMYEVDRLDTFGDKSDFMILNYCYKVEEEMVSVYPSKDLTTLELLDKNVIDKISILKDKNEQQDEIINIQLMATDELYMMVEPLLNTEVQTYTLGGNRMVDMYVAMVQRGLKTIDEVPLRYREQVRAILEELEK